MAYCSPHYQPLELWFETQMLNLGWIFLLFIIFIYIYFLFYFYYVQKFIIIIYWNYYYSPTSSTGSVVRVLSFLQWNGVSNCSGKVLMVLNYQPSHCLHLGLWRRVGVTLREQAVW